MIVNNYQPNSHKFKQEQQEENTVEKKKTGKVISGTARVKKKNEIQKFADVFISEDAGNVKDYILMDLLIPGLKKLTVSIIKSAAEIIFGETGLDRRSDSGGRAPYVSYNDYSRRREDRRTESRARTGYRFEDVILETRGEAERVLDILHEKLAEYGTVSVAELYEAVGLSSEYTDYNYGWTKLRDAEPSRVMGGGYTLNLPRPIPLK
jgi:hypothetical protein